MVLRAALLLGLGLGATTAQHHHHDDPFAGSGCNCTAFCADECAINATGPATITQYRMTQFGVVDMNNKNTGDMAGDTSFVIDRRTSAYECRQDPTSFMCSGIAQFDGDEPNSTDLVLEWELDVDGKWGPYLMCNPIDSAVSDGPWSCRDSLGHPMVLPAPPASYPPACAAKFRGAENYCVTDMGFNKQGQAPAADLSACCATATSEDVEGFTYLANGTCQLFKYAFEGANCTGGVSGVAPPPPPPPANTDTNCECKRINQTVGREGLGHGSSGGGGGGGGENPSEGECFVLFLVCF